MTLDVRSNGGDPLRLELDRLWHEYRDDEHAAFVDYVLPDDNMGDVTWEDYKAVFQRFPSFPDWLRERGALG